MTPPNERKAAERQRRKEAGLVRVEVWVPRDRAKEVAIALAQILHPTAKGACGLVSVNGGGAGP
jgi:hypothetical protein